MQDHFEFQLTERAAWVFERLKNNHLNEVRVMAG